MTLKTRRERALAQNHYAQLFGDGPVVAVPDRRVRVVDPTVPSEHASQSVVISWWTLNCRHYGLPAFSLFAIPNGGVRDAITGARLKAEGVRAGILDLMLAVKRDEFGGLFIEMKKPGNTPSPAQKEVIEYLQRAGYCCRVRYTSDEAIESIRTYLRRSLDGSPA